MPYASAKQKKIDALQTNKLNQLETDIVDLQGKLGDGLVEQVTDSNGAQVSQVTIPESNSTNSAQVTHLSEGKIAEINNTGAAFTSKMARGKNFILSRQGIVVGVEEDDEVYATAADLTTINSSISDLSNNKADNEYNDRRVWPPRFPSLTIVQTFVLL